MLRALAPAVKLPIRFDAAALSADLRTIPGDAWTPHFNTAYFEGSWSGVPLRAPAGESHPIRQLHPDPTCRHYVDTACLTRLPRIQEAVARFRCPLLSVRLLRLAGGSRIKEHQDHDLALEDGEIRVHVPIETSPDVEFVVGGAPIAMGAGEAWYLNFNLPHSVTNGGPEARVHLVLDCVVDDWIRRLVVPEGESDAR